MKKKIHNYPLYSFSIPLYGHGIAVLGLPMPISKENYDYIKSWIELMEPAIVDNSIEPETNKKEG